MDANTKYHDLKKEDEQGIYSMHHFFLNRFLKAREDLGMPSNDGYSADLVGIKKNDRNFDEDANVYIVHLLLDFCGGVSSERLSKWVSDSELKIKCLVDDASRAEKFMIYRTNADSILFNLGILCNFSGEEKEEQAVVRGKRYYAWSAGYASEISGGRNGLVEVLEKLSIRFEDYAAILKHMTQEYFDFTHKISHNDLTLIQRFHENKEN